MVQMFVITEEMFLLHYSFFSENYTDEARQVLSHANHPKLG